MRRVGGQRLAGDGVVEDGARREDVACRIAAAAVPHLRRHEFGAGWLGARRDVGEGVTAKPEIGDGAASGRSEQQRGRDDAPDHDAPAVGVIERGEDIARQGVHGGNRPGPALDRVEGALPVDPAARAKGDLPEDAGVVHVTDGGMIELGQRLRLAEEPAAQGAVRVEVDAQAHPALQDEIVGLEQDPLARSGDGPVDPVAMAERGRRPFGVEAGIGERHDGGASKVIG